MDRALMVLEMTQRPSLNVTGPHRSGMLLRLEEPSVAFYRYLLGLAAFDSDNRWLGATDQELFDRLGDPSIEVFTLYVGGAPAGCYELDRRTACEVELALVAVFPEFHGRGFERYLLALAVDTAWEEDPDRLWVGIRGEADRVNLLLYQWAGFVPVAADLGQESVE